jgi:tRNA-specific 2-thiouridylase
MGLPHFTLDLREEFRAGVVQPYLDEHKTGLTPNPCIRCNGHVRLDEMLTFAERLGGAKLATGHYARVIDDEQGPLLALPVDANKDQTYMLSALSPKSLAKMSFPLGSLHKPQVRDLARKAKLPVASKPDSQDLCFLAGTDRASFLARHGEIEGRKGEIVDLDGQVLGYHAGYHRFTVGQRRGLGIAARTPLYVLRIDAHNNRVVVGTREQLGMVRVSLRNVTLHRDGSLVDRVKLRYRAKAYPCQVRGTPSSGRYPQLTVELLEPSALTAPGQTACLMGNDFVLGWGTIVTQGHNGVTNDDN